MKKRIFCALMCLCLAASLALPAFAAENAESEAPKRVLRIASERQFLRFAENCRLDSYSQGLTVELTADLDLSGADFEGVPIFCGEFQGGGHRISGLELTGGGSQIGLFRYLTGEGVISDLTVLGKIDPEGSRENIGGIVGSSAGEIRNCDFEGEVSGSSAVGGIVGENGLSGVIEKCHVRGSVSGSHFVGGIAGNNAGVIRACTNNAAVNTTAVENTVTIADISLKNMVSSESAATVTDIGGIAGHSNGVIRVCVNHADVGYQHMGYNVGGIAGTQAGHIVGCENRGSVLGRKEVGGIVGQMEPAASIEYAEDALQILRRQLDGMGSIVSKTAANVKNTGDRLYGQVYDLQEYVEGAQDSIGLLIPSKDDPKLPDADTIQAAKNGLSTSFSGMSGTLNGMQATVESSVGKLSNNLHAMQNQMNAMNATLGNASETLGGTITDVSDDDTDLDLTGKVLGCKNSGKVQADLNAGGIAGAMALENDLDVVEDLEVLGESSLNFESRLRAVILDCENSGSVTAGKRAAGGITGWQSLGLVKNCRSSGPLEGGEYVGGIAGQSSAYIRDCGAKCSLSGTQNVGGIAGGGAIVTGCLSMVDLRDADEKTGAVLGTIEKTNIEEEEPIGGNFYLVLDRDFGGIDGVSYDGQAQSLGRGEFFRLEGLPELFRRAVVTFVYEDGQDVRYAVETGGALSADVVPKLPEKTGAHGYWQDLSAGRLKNIYLDQTFQAAYEALPTVVSSGGRQASVLLQGLFPEGTELVISEAAPELVLEEGEALLAAWNLELSQAGEERAVRVRLPEETDGDAVRVMVQKNGQWENVGHRVDGSYVVAEVDGNIEAVALVGLAAPNYLPWILAGGGVVLVGLLVLLAAKKKKK